MLAPWWRRPATRPVSSYERRSASAGSVTLSGANRIPARGDTSQQCNGWDSISREQKRFPPTLWLLSLIPNIDLGPGTASSCPNPGLAEIPQACLASFETVSPDTHRASDPGGEGSRTARRCTMDISSQLVTTLFRAIDRVRKETHCGLSWCKIR